MVVTPFFKGRHADRKSSAKRDPESRLEEIARLAEAIGLEVVDRQIAASSSPRPATLLGKGKVEELALLVHEKEAELVIIDHALSPVQQKNLETAFNAKVIDRTGLILEIFGERAATKEGKLQVDLAFLNYQKGRLVRSWTHLERQRGGAGFMGGPGETQIEADRRALQDKIVRLEKDLEQVRRTRQLHRSKRQKVPHPIVALVGYTNAGKSTLFNRLTGAGVLAKDILFATLDPTLRQLKLPHGRTVILSDTVGFISDLPTHLIAAFRATLEEVRQADLILHVRDIADPDSQNQADDVLGILDNLGVGAKGGSAMLEIWNKIDLAPTESGGASWQSRAEKSSAIAVSALTGRGLDTLLLAIEQRLSGHLKTVTLHVPGHRMADVSWLYDHGDVTDRIELDDGGLQLTLDMTEHALEQWARRTGQASNGKTSGSGR